MLTAVALHPSEIWFEYGLLPPSRHRDIPDRVRVASPLGKYIDHETS
jgi:hypothetical protein